MLPGTWLASQKRSPGVPAFTAKLEVVIGVLFSYWKEKALVRQRGQLCLPLHVLSTWGGHDLTLRSQSWWPTQSQVESKSSFLFNNSLMTLLFLWLREQNDWLRVMRLHPKHELLLVNTWPDFSFSGHLSCLQTTDRITADDYRQIFSRNETNPIQQLKNKSIYHYQVGLIPGMQLMKIHVIYQS